MGREQGPGRQKIMTECYCLTGTSLNLSYVLCLSSRATQDDDGLINSDPLTKPAVAVKLSEQAPKFAI